MEAIYSYWQLSLVAGIFILVLTALSYLGLTKKDLSSSALKSSKDFRLAYEAISNAHESKEASDRKVFDFHAP
jgi:hypothetical protein